MSNLQAYARLTPGARQDLLALFEPVALNKGDILVAEGQRVSHCHLLKNGIIRSYFTNEGREYNKKFFIEGMFPTPITALLTKSPSLLGFQALADCEIMRFPYQGFVGLFDKHRCLETLMRRIMERVWIQREIHEMRMIKNDASTNFQLFRKEYPGLENMIPQEHIASYLGITISQLNRIRSLSPKPSETVT